MSKAFADASLSLFRNSFDSTPQQTVTLMQILEAIRSGRYQPKVHTLRQILAREGKAAYDRAKAYLPAVTFAGTFLPKRGNGYLQQHSGLVWCDIDDVRDIAATKRAICSDPRTVCLFTSPSGIGLKAGIHGPTITDDTAYKHVWNATRVEYEQLYGVQWDPSGKDVSRLCFVSYDPDLYINLQAVCFDVPPPARQESSPPKPTPAKTSTTNLDRSDDHVVRACKTAAQMIEAAELGTRHHTRLRAARLLGGFVAGGFLSHDQAYTILKEALRDHTEDLDRALKTVEDGLKYGEAHPITLEALEGERQAWIEQHRRHHTRPRLIPPDTDPWDGMSSLPLKPYTGYRSRLGRATRHG